MFACTHEHTVLHASVTYENSLLLESEMVLISTSALEQQIKLF